MNKACPKDKFPTPFIEKIINECAGHEVISFMDGFSGYKQICICYDDQLKNTFTSQWGNVSYKAMPFDLNNVGATF